MVTPYREAEVKHKQLFINNRWVDAADGKTFPTINPANEGTICEVAEAKSADVDLAVTAAQEAFKRNSVWRKMDASNRGRLLMKVADLIDGDISYISSIETLDTGKPFLAAVDDLKHTAEVYRYYGGLADKMGGKVLAPDGQYFSYTKAEPLGVCGLIIPWNYPSSLFAWKVGPCLASGNTCVVKPSELSPLSALVQASYFLQAGFPPGVLNVLPGFGPTAGAALSSHAAVRKVAFTGSTQTGQKIMTAAAGNLKKLTMELGGKSPIVIFEDTDLDQAALFCRGSIMDNCGQNCCAGSRNYVHADIYDDFVSKAKACAENTVTGDPWDPISSNGAMISETQMERVMSYIEKGKAEGAKLECGGVRLGDKGYFLSPTVFSGVTDDMTIAKEEIFGPVQSILKFTDMEDVLDRCNATEYGLAAGVFTKDIDRAMYMAHNLQGGITWINCADSMTVQTPFGGFKQSGFGKELGEDAMKEYCGMKTIMMKVTNKNS